MRLQIFWRDSRLNWTSAIAKGAKYKGITLEMLQKIWFPDIFVGEEPKAITNYA